MASAVEELEQLVARVEANLDKQRARLQALIDSSLLMQGLTPDDLADGQGRPILLDAQIALLNARVALVQAGAV